MQTYTYTHIRIYKHIYIYHVIQEAYDDTDLYQLLLRDLIESGASQGSDAVELQVRICVYVYTRLCVCACVFSTTYMRRRLRMPQKLFVHAKHACIRVAYVRTSGYVTACFSTCARGAVGARIYECERVFVCVYM
jgi:hypothetical protein